LDEELRDEGLIPEGSVELRPRPQPEGHS